MKDVTWKEGRKTSKEELWEDRNRWIDLVSDGSHKAGISYEEEEFQ